MRNQILELSDVAVVRADAQADALPFFKNNTVAQPLLNSAGVGAHKTARPKKCSAEITRHDDGCVVNIFSEKNVQHRPSGCSGRLSVVAAAGKLVAAAYGEGGAVVTGVPVLLFGFFNKGESLFFRGNGGYGCDKAGLFFRNLARSSFVCKTK